MGGAVLYLKRFLKAKDTYARNAIVQKYMRDKLLEILRAQHRVDFKYIFEFGAGNGEFTALLRESVEFESYVCNDINDYKVHFDDTRMRYECFDMNALSSQSIMREKFYLITSNAALQWLDCDVILPHLAEILHKQGLLLLSTFATQNLREIAESTGFSLPYLNKEQMKMKLEKHFEVLHLETERICLKFENTLDVFRHLKLSGVNSLGDFFLGKKFLKTYKERFRNTLTYEPMYILCRK